MWWLKPPYTIGIYSSIDELEALHSHGRNTTEVVWGSDLEARLTNLRACLQGRYGLGGGVLEKIEEEQNPITAARILTAEGE